MKRSLATAAVLAFIIGMLATLSFAWAAKPPFLQSNTMKLTVLEYLKNNPTVSYTVNYASGSESHSVDVADLDLSSLKCEKTNLQKSNCTVAAKTEAACKVENVEFQFNDDEGKSIRRVVSKGPAPCIRFRTR